MEWTKADPALIGQDAVYHGPVVRIIKITGASDDLMYYWSRDEIFPSFLVEPKSRLGRLWAQIRRILRQFGRKLRLWASAVRRWVKGLKA